MRNKIAQLLLAVSLVCGTTAYGQTPDIRRYINNIVDIEGGNFGLIVGNKGEDNLFFITATANDDESPSALNVRFYRDRQRGAATLIKKFDVGNTQFFLYAVKVSTPVKWDPYSFASAGETAGPFYSFLDNGKSDSVWYINSSKILLNEKVSKEVVQLKVGREDVFYKGMPVIDNANRIVGIAAQSQGEGELAFLTIDMKVIAKKLNDFSGCNYFKLIEFGQSATPCDVQKKIVEQDTRQEKLARQDNQIYGIASGPAFSVHLNFVSDVGQQFATGVGYSLGYNFYLWPDKGRVKMTLKPRYTRSPFKVHPDATFSNSIGFKPKSFIAKEVEMPIMVEFLTKRNSESGSAYFSLGYIPGYQFPYVYRYSTKARPGTMKGTHDGVTGIVHKAGAELGYQGPTTRISFIAAYQLTPWYDDEHILLIENRAVHPVDAGYSYLTLGIDIAFRLKGNWGLKTR